MVEAKHITSICFFIVLVAQMVTLVMVDKGDHKCDGAAKASTLSTVGGQLSQSAVDPLASEFNALLDRTIRSADIAGATYTSQQATCESLAKSGTVSSFLEAAYSMQSSIGSDVAYLYVSYQFPGTTHWGDCGCLHDGTGVDCYYVGTDGVEHNYNGADFNRPGAVVAGSYADNEDYIVFIKEMTKADAVGRWQPPYSYFDDVQNKNIELLTYSVPMAYDATSGKCTLAISIDISMADVQSAMQTRAGGQLEDLLLVDSGLMPVTPATTGGIRFVASSWFTPSAGGGHPVMAVSDSRIVGFAKDLVDYNLMAKTSESFSKAGFAYEVRQVGPRMLLAGRKVVNAGLQKLRQQVSAVFTETVERTKAMKEFTSTMTRTSDFASPTTKLQNFLKDVEAIQAHMGKRVIYVYASYKLSNGVWGDAGCQLFEKQVECYYIGADAVSYNFLGTNFSAKVINVPDASTAGLHYQKEIAKMRRSTDSGGRWQYPDVYSDITNGISYPVETFSVPIMYDIYGYCTAAVSIDVRLSEVTANMASAGVTPADSSVVLFDPRTNHLLADYPLNLLKGAHKVITVTASNSTAFNKFMSVVVSSVKTLVNFARMTAFSDKNMFYASVPVGPFALVQFDAAPPADAAPSTGCDEGSHAFTSTQLIQVAIAVVACLILFVYDKFVWAKSSTVARKALDDVETSEALNTA